MITAEQVKIMARDCGFELAGVTGADPHQDYERYQAWAALGMAGQMGYLLDRRGEIRGDPRLLLSSARSIICVGKVYNTPYPYSNGIAGGEGWIARYAWGNDYHTVVSRGLERLRTMLQGASAEPFEAKICVDTAPLLERSYARLAGLGWIGKNTCLIHEQIGSWFFLGELLTSLELEPDEPLPDRCGTCSRCIEACPTAALEPGTGGTRLDARRCISYLSIEKKGAFTAEEQRMLGHHVFGCDICQDVCPWNSRAAVTGEEGFAPRMWPLAHLSELADLSEAEFRERYADTPLWRTRHRGFLRNVIAALGNCGTTQHRPLLERLSGHPDDVVAAAARTALDHLPAGDTRGDSA